MIDCIFHQSEYPYKFIQKIQVAKDKFWGAMLVNSNQEEQERTNDFVLFTMSVLNDDQTPCKLVKIARD